MNSAPTRGQALWGRIRVGVGANLVPGVILQVFALAIVALYYGWKPAGPFFHEVASLKQRFGYVYSGLATAFFGGLLPYLVLLKTGQVPENRRGGWALFFLLVWCWRGIEVDALYRMQASLFGESTEWKVIVTKVIVDQFVYCPLWAAPTGAICYLWRDLDFSFEAVGKRLGRNFFLLEIPSFLVATWIVWIPATAIIYSLPTPLQVPLFNLVLCFFVLMVSVIRRKN